MKRLHLSKLVQTGQGGQVHASHSVQGQRVDHLVDDILAPGVEELVEEDGDPNCPDVHGEDGEHQQHVNDKHGEDNSEGPFSSLEALQVVHEQRHPYHDQHG